MLPGKQAAPRGPVVLTLPLGRVTPAVAESLKRVLGEHPGATEVHLKSGSLYPILVRLADRGLLETSWEPGAGSRPPRHLYRLTGDGRDFVAALTASRVDRTVPATHNRWSEA